MAEATGLRNNALPYPVYGVPHGVKFSIYDADGDLVTGATGLDSEISKNGDTFTDCTNEATEIATSSGVYYLLLTASEMTADAVAVIVKTNSTGAKTTLITFNPRKLVALRSGTAQGGAAGYITLDASAGSRDDRWNGCLCVATIDSLVEARIITDYTGSNQQAAVTPSWNVTPDSDDTFIIYLPEGMQNPTVNVSHISEQSQTARDIGESVLLSAGTGTGQLDFSSGVMKANVTQYGGVAGTFASGRPEVNATHVGGSSIVQSGGYISVDLTKVNNVAVTSTGGYLEVDTAKWAGTAVGSVMVNVNLETIKGQNVTCGAAVTIAPFVGNSTAAIAVNGSGYVTITNTIPAVGDIADAVWDEAQSGHTTAGTFGKYLDTEVSGVGGGGGVSEATLVKYISLLVREDGAVGTDLSTELGNINQDYGSGGGSYNQGNHSLMGILNRGDLAWITATGFSTHSVADIWNESQSGYITAGTFGYYVDAQISSVSGGGGVSEATLTKYIALLARKDSAIGTDLSTELGNINQDYGSGSGAYLNTSDSHEAIRDNMGTAQTGDAYVIVNNGTYGNQAIKTAVDSLAPASDVSSSFNQTYGSVISGTYTNTATDDNSRHVLAPDATNALDADYTFTIPVDNKPTRVTINGYFNGTAQYADVFAYNYETAAYVQLSNSTTRMNTRTSDTNYTYELSREYVEDGVGTVKIRFTSPSTNTAHRLHLDRILVYSLTEAGTEAGLTAQNVWEYTTREITGGTITTYTGNTPQTGDVYARVGSPAGASVSADIADMKSDTTSILARIGAFAGSGVNNILGFMRAIMRKDATLPSDVGGTYAVATDSLEGQVDTGSGGISLNADRTAAFNALLDAVIRGEAVTDGANTARIFKTNLTTANSHVDYTGQVLFFDSGVSGDNSKMKRRILDHDLTTGIITLDIGVDSIPATGDEFSITGYQSSVV